MGNPQRCGVPLKMGYISGLRYPCSFANIVSGLPFSSFVLLQKGMQRRLYAFSAFSVDEGLFIAGIRDMSRFFGWLTGSVW